MKEDFEEELVCILPSQPREFLFCLDVCQAGENGRQMHNSALVEARIWDAQKTPVPRRHVSQSHFQQGNKRPQMEGRPPRSSPTLLTSIYQFISVLKGDVTLFSNTVPLRERPE